MKGEKITCHVKLLCKEGKVDQLLDALALCAQESRNEPGCEYYEVIQNIDNPLEITLVEKYTTYQDFQDHFKTPAIKNFIDMLQYELLDNMRNSLHITRIDCIGTVSEKFDMDHLAEIMKDESVSR